MFSQPAKSGFKYPPQRPGYCPIWALIDVPDQDSGLAFRLASNIWPIHVSPPDPILWKSWHKQSKAALWGDAFMGDGGVGGRVRLQLIHLSPFLLSIPAISFNRGSLSTFLRLRSFSLLPKYNEFRSSLEGSLPLLRGSTPSKTAGEHLNATLEVLHQARGREKVEAAAAMVGRDTTGDDVGVSDIDQDENVDDEAVQQRVPVYKVEEVFRILVRTATEEFGFAPRNVYDGVLNFLDTRKQHATTVRSFDYSGLKTLVKAFINRRGLNGSSHRVLVVYPCKPSLNRDNWEINFKSFRIAMDAVESMRLKGDKHLQGTYDTLHKMPQSFLLAGWIFKAIAHRAFSSGSALQWTPMISDHDDPPTFFTSNNPSSLPIHSLSYHSLSSSD